MPATWVLTGSLENFRATREHGFPGQLRTVSDADARLIERRLREAAGAAAPAG